MARLGGRGQEVSLSVFYGLLSTAVAAPALLQEAEGSRRADSAKREAFARAFCDFRATSNVRRACVSHIVLTCPSRALSGPVIYIYYLIWLIQLVVSYVCSYFIISERIAGAPLCILAGSS